MFITPALSINPAGKVKRQLQGRNPVGHTQLSAMTFWLCHHGLSSKLLTFRSSLKTFSSSLVVQLLFFRCHEGCKDTYLLKGIMQEQVAIASSPATGLPNDLGKVRAVPRNNAI